MAGRKPKLVETIQGNRSKKELEDRKNFQPICESTWLDIPKELTSAEKKKWNEMVDLIKSFKKSPNNDADKDKLIRYCKSWCRYISLDEALRKKPNDKDIIKLLNAEDKNLNKLGSDLMLDPISRIKIGNARAAPGGKLNNDDDNFFD